MAQKVNIILEDDLDGSEATGTHAFTFEGTSYEIDLNDKNAAKLRKALEPFVQAARKVGRPAGRSTRKAGSNGATPAAVREWATAHGYEVPARGRIPATVRSAYEAAN